jgi:cytosine/creatinine deaminase
MNEYDLVLRGARIKGETELQDVAVKAGCIAARGALLAGHGDQEVDAGGRLLVPGLVESHVHLDIALMDPFDLPGRQEPYTTQAGMVANMERRRQEITHDEMIRRAGQALEMASLNGVTALRAQCQVDDGVGLKHLDALLALRAQFANRVDLKITAFPAHGLFQRDPDAPARVRAALRAGANAVGGSASHDRSVDGQGDYRRRHFDIAFELAAEFGVDLDLHSDLSLPDQAGLEDLDVVMIARKALEGGYQGRVTVGHLSALDSALPEVQAEAIELIKTAQLSVISLPDLYRLGRADTHHVRRGLTRVKELLAAGVNVALASNNVRDALRPLGNFNLIEEALILAYGAHMDSLDQLKTLLDMITVNPARALKLPGYGLEPGCFADLVVLDAPSPSAVIVGQAPARWVFKRGRLVAETLVKRQGFR